MKPRERRRRARAERPRSAQALTPSQRRDVQTPINRVAREHRAIIWPLGIAGFGPAFAMHAIEPD